MRKNALVAVVGSFEVFLALGTPSFDNAPVVQTLDSAIHQAPVVQKVDSTIHWINHYPLDSAIGFRTTYPLDSDLSGG